MANIYVRSTDGSDADNGSTWALAKATLAGATAIDAAGDTIYVSDAHSESTASAININFAGTAASPVRVICGDDAAEPPTTEATTAVVATSGGSSININGSAYIYGVTFRASANNGGANIAIAPSTDGVSVFESCILHVNSTSSANQITAGNNAGSELIRFTDSEIKFNNAGHSLAVASSRVEIHGGGIASGSTALTGAFIRNQATARGFTVDVAGFDMSNLGSASYLCAPGNAACRIMFRNCKLPASWAGALVSAAPTGPGGRAEMHNCDNADTNYRLWVEDYAGSIVSDTGVYNDAGATDGTTRLSWKMTTNANAEFDTTPLISPEFVQWNDTTGSSKTVTVEIVHNSQGSGTSGALTDGECWLEVMYLGTSGYPQGAWITDRKASILTTATDQDSSSAAWTGDSAGWDTQKLSVTFTPQEKGYIHARVVLAKASATVYVDPLITVS